jgi:HK97 family phage portal protein
VRLLGFEISRTKAAGQLSSVDSRRGWWPLIREPFAGAWQRNREVRADTSLANPVLFRCISLISSDVAKMRLRLVEQDSNGIWNETESPAFSPVLRKPNRFQTRIQFFASWMISKLTFGNTYVLKVRDDRKVVVALYILDPNRVKPLVAPDGSVFYQLGRDDLSGLTEDVPAIPASEIIHDRWNCLFHPLVGLSPIFACGLAALQGLEIQNNSTSFFQNGSKPGGILSAPGAISNDTAQRLKDHWDSAYTGQNAGKVAVLGDGLSYVPMAVNAVDSQLIEQLKWSAEIICGCFGVPAYMAGVGSAPLNNNVESLAQLYYGQCLQPHIEGVEACLDEGLGIGYGVKTENRVLGTEFDLDDLLRMDTATQLKTLTEGLKGIYSSNEARKKVNLKPVKGGDAVLSQQQNFSLEALAKRDALDDPFGAAKPEPAPPPEEEPANDDAPNEAEAAKALLAIHKGFANVGR